MGKLQTLVCLANSYRADGHCFAGKALSADEGGGWIRPVSLRAGSELSKLECQLSDGTTPRLLDLIRVELLGRAIRCHQTENVVVGPKGWERVGEFPWAWVPALCDRPDTLWTNGGRTEAGLRNCVNPAEACQVRQSLLFVSVGEMAICVGTCRRTGRASYHGAFTYNDVAYVLAVTDPVARAAFSGHDDGEYPLGDAFLSVSLTQVFAGDGRCHKLIAGILTNPRL